VQAEAALACVNAAFCETPLPLTMLAGVPA
jgi:hypothetical protein